MEADVRQLAQVATAEGFIAAHALPNFVPLLRSLIPQGSGTRVGGPIGFPSVQAAAEASRDAAWLFADGDPNIGILQGLMHATGVTSSEVSMDGYELFEGLSSPLAPADLAAFTS